MKRTLKFRLWCPAGKKFYFNPILVDGKSYCWNREETELVPWYSSEQVQAYGEPVLQQFTGMVDNHGKDIYEGDFLKITRTERHGGKDNIFPVEWSEHSLGFTCISLIAPYHQPQVVGNIFENPELFKP